MAHHTKPATRFFAAVCLLAACAGGRPIPGPPGRRLDDVVFTRYSPLSRVQEIARRVLTPLTFHAGRQGLEVHQAGWREQAIDLAQERFSVYVPAGIPPKAGWGLFVFIAPWSDPTRPNLWRPPLDRHGFVLVAASNSGNDASVYDRRLPLALLAFENARALYPIDPARVYVGGLSGGSRVAEIAALAYPDVFRGALLNAGSEPIGGEAGIYLPPDELFRRFQQSRLVYITGAKDEVNLLADGVSRDSMLEHCVFDLVQRQVPRLAHEPLDAASLDWALGALEQHAAVDPELRRSCTRKLEGELEAQLADAQRTVDRGDKAGALARLKSLDARFGGLAAPRSVELEARRMALP